MEELKKDVESSKLLQVHKIYMDNIQELGLSKIKVNKANHELTLGKIKFDKEGLLAAADKSAAAAHFLHHLHHRAGDKGS